MLAECEILTEQFSVLIVHQRTRYSPAADLDCRIAALPAQYCAVEKRHNLLLGSILLESLEAIDEYLGQVAHVVDETVLHRALHRAAYHVEQRRHEQRVNQQQHQHEAPGDCVQVSCHNNLIVLTPCNDSASLPHM